MYRKAKSKIINWYRKSNKALLITGARQVGKTFIIEEFLEELVGADNYVEINLLENVAARKAIEEARDGDDLLFRLSAFTEKRMVKNKTIVFFDEVQECKNIITAIKFLVKQGDYRYILSGSLLGIELDGIKSLPVGYMQSFQMYPLDFEEFLIANGLNENVIEKLKESFENLTSVDEFLHKKLLDAFQLYLIVGGMPAVVNKYRNTNNLKDVVEEERSINELYRLDIGKYDPSNKLYIKEIFDLIPSELNNQNKRFIMKNINEGNRFSRYENSFVWLKDAGVALPCFCVDDPKVPLMLSKSKNLFKLYHCDVGLLCCMYMDNNLQIKILNKEKDINFGSIYENAVAEELSSHGFDLYYYRSNKLGEVDFLLESKGEVVPIEVKSGKDYKIHNALNHFLQSPYGIKKGYVLSNGNIEVDGNTIYLPIYMIMFFKKDELRDMKYRIDLSVL